MSTRVPLIVILGATGTGKSKLSIEIARRFSGEIISADSMQVYKGLDIITNKVTEEEKQMAPHHLLDFLDPLEKYKVVDFRDKALPIIEKLIKEGKPPIVVGGTHYYIESLVWKILVENLSSHTDRVTLESCIHEIQDWTNYYNFLLSKFTEKNVIAPEIEIRKYESALSSIVDCPNKEVGLKRLLDNEDTTELQCENVLSQIRAVVTSLLRTFGPVLDLHPEKEISKLEENICLRLHEKLKLLDPEMAKTLHPKNKRKIIRSLQVLAQQGRKHSEILKEQQELGGSYLGGPLRFKNSVMLWIQCQEDVLNRRLDDRVDQMISKGLIRELTAFHESYNKARIDNMDTSTAYTQGIFQSIGFKEFHEYLILPEEKRESPLGQEMLKDGIELLKSVTRRYAKRQKKWITNRFLKGTGREVPPVYALDATDLSKWSENVFRPAEAIVSKILNPELETEIPRPIAKIVDDLEVGDLKTENYCEVCERVFIGKLQWDAHLISKKHQRVAKRKLKIHEKTNKRLKD